MIRKANDVDQIKMTNPLADGASMKVLVGEKEGWSDYVMREMILEPGGHAPKHSHPWPHINYIISGSGTLEIEGELTEVQAGDHAFIPNDALHQFKNISDEPFVFICIVPKNGHQ